MSAAVQVDLRSDTVTRPDAAMRRAMAEAEVGDDVFGEDPTINRLQETVAEMLGAEAALFVPTGTMANQIAIAVHTRPGDEMLVGRGAHNWLFETGAAAAISGVQPCQIGAPEAHGRFTADDVREAFKPDSHHTPPSRLLSIENTHNLGGGRVWDRAELAEVMACGRELGMGLHLDGARLWNAAVACDVEPGELAAGFDTISVCLSKGLAAPVGSVLAGTTALIDEGHRIRKRLGGGMRQAGILAAAGLHALAHNRARLVDDHANARYLAEAIGELPGLRTDPSAVDTNIVMVDLEAHAAAELEARARAAGLAFVSVERQRIRLVTHRDVDRAGCERAVAILGELVAG